jgi:hypothetical protein
METRRECPDGCSDAEVIFPIDLHLPFAPASFILFHHALFQISCVTQMRELDATATDDASGADLLRFARARKCNAAAALQVAFALQLHADVFIKHCVRYFALIRLFSCLWRASSGPMSSIYTTFLARGPWRQRLLICASSVSIRSTGQSYTAVCLWS